jgi:outer membrane lipoprotein-sorting protein
MNLIPPQPDDPLARAEDAWRRLPVPSGPSGATTARTLASLSRAATASRRWPRQILKIAAVLMLVAGLVSVLSWPRSGAPLAFAEVAQKLRDAQTLVYKITVQSPELKEPVTFKQFLKEPGLLRMEQPGGMVGIGQMGQMKTMTINPATKTAFLMEVKKLDRSKDEEADPARLAEGLRKLVEENGKPAGKKRIGDVDALGFRVERKHNEWLVWADPKTKLPLQAEVTLPHDTKAILSDFQFNPPLEDALFSLQPPEGYKLETMAIEALAPEAALVRLLRDYAGHAKGEFPKKLDDPAAFGKARFEAEGKKPKEKPSAEDMQYVVNMTQAILFVNSLKKNYVYRPEAGKLGDAHKMLFWYRPEKAEKYRVLYADLHWADVAAEQLPRP